MNIDQTVIDAVVAHAIEDIPREACGLIVLADGKQQYMRCRNVSPKAVDFKIHDEDYAAANEAGEIVAVAHSHPFTGVEPTFADRTACEISGLPWLVVTPRGAHRTIEPCGWQAPLEGRKYLHGVHDCHSLARDWFAINRDVKLDSFAHVEEGWEARGEDHFTANVKAQGFVEVSLSSLEPGDVVFFQVLGSDVPNHMAVWLGDGRILHQLRDKPSKAEFYQDHWKKRAVSAWRYAR